MSPVKVSAIGDDQTFGFACRCRSEEEPFSIDSLISMRDLRIELEVLTESLILAQDERWRRA